MPIKKRSSSTATQSVKVYVMVNPEGGLIVRTPAVCTKWDMDFRARITAGYAPPKTLKPKSSHKDQYERHSLGARVYEISKNKLRVVHVTQELEGAYVLVLRTDVENLTTGKRLFLNNDDPAMRMLMIYVFLTGETIPGVPELQIADITEE